MERRLDARVLAVAREVALDLAGQGAEAVVLVGSHARGEAGPESDLDLLAVGSGSYPPRLDVRSGLLVSTSMQPFAAHRESFALPELVCEAVPGWRDALILRDPDGIAAALIQQSRVWAWDTIKQRCDAWVAAGITARAETVYKLVSALNKRRHATAAEKRSLLTTRLARILAVHHRVLYGSETHLWEVVAKTMGEEWRRSQRVAFGISDEPFEETCRAALRLYGIAAAEVRHLLDERQERVVGYATGLISDNR